MRCAAPRVRTKQGRLCHALGGMPRVPGPGGTHRHPGPPAAKPGRRPGLPTPRCPLGTGCERKHEYAAVRPTSGAGAPTAARVCNICDWCATKRGASPVRFRDGCRGDALVELLEERGPRGVHGLRKRWSRLMRVYASLGGARRGERGARRRARKQTSRPPLGPCRTGRAGNRCRRKNPRSQTSPATTGARLTDSRPFGEGGDGNAPANTAAL